MQILLKPPPDSGLADIEITRRLFAIGRRQRPFDSYPRSAVSKLSKRHARLFVEGTVLYGLDLGSLNGSTRNGKPLSTTPEPLSSGDILTFGGLTYELLIQEPPAEVAAPRPLRLVLKPASADSLLEPAVISEFPYLINKHSDLFRRVAEQDTDQLAYLSRNHAQLTRLDNDFYIEDLGSTNGTWINGELIEEHLRQLADGDRIGLGGDQLVYQAYVVEVTGTVTGASTGPTQEEAAETVLVSSITGAPEASEVFDSSRTIFVDSATSFIDVYFNEQQSPAAESPEADASAVNTPNAGQQSVGGAIVTALVGNNFNGKRVLGAVGLIAAVVATGAAFQYWRGADDRALEELLANGEHRQALALLNELLIESPDDEELRDSATEAMLDTYLGDWLGAYQSADFAGAKAAVTQARKAGSANADDDALLDIMDWSAQTRAFLRNRGATTRGVSDPFSEARLVGELLTVWKEDQNQRSRELRILKDANKDFAPAHAAVFADVRRLRELELDAAPMRELQDALQLSLPMGDTEQVRLEIEQALKNQRSPRVATLLGEELAAYARLQAALTAERWLDAFSFSDSGGFATEPFQKYMQSLTDTRLPDAQFRQAYANALGHWQDGKFDESEQALIALVQTPWASVARRRLETQRKLLSQLQQLTARREAADYPIALFDFYAALDPVADQGLVASLRPDFMAHSRDALKEATNRFARAEQDWQRYRSVGGIQTELRLESEVSAAYTKLAGLLTRSYQDFNRGLQIYLQLSVKPSSTWSALRDDLIREISVQRSALANLQVLPPSVREGKLALLPNPE